jgi:hypothetical protein
MVSRYRSLHVLLFVILIVGCGDDGSTTGSLPTGALYGDVILTSYRNGYTDHSGVKVTLKGTTHTAMTDATGRWEMSNLPTRTYTLVYEKPGFGTMEEHGIVFVGGGHVNVGSIGLYEVPSCGVELEAVREDQPGVIMAYAHSDCPLGVHTDMAVFYFSHSPDVSKENFVLAVNGTFRSVGTIQAELNTADPIYFRGLDKAKPIYVVAYHNGGQSYWDPVLKRYIFPAIHPQPSRVLSVQLSD